MTILKVTSLMFLFSPIPMFGLTPPIAKRVEKKLEKHGDVRIDPYFWLRERESPEVVKYLEEENKFTNAMMKDSEPVANKLFEEMKAKIKLADETAPYKRNGYEYFSKTSETDDYPRYFQRQIGKKEEVLILDVNELAKGNSFTAIRNLAVSSDNKLMAYAHDKVGRNIFTIYIKDLESGKLTDHVIEKVTGNLTWAMDGKTLFYGQQDPKTLRQFQIYRYNLESKKSTLVYEEKDETFSAYVSRSLTDKFIFIGSYSTLTSEIRYLDASKPEGEFKIFQPRVRGVEYSVQDGIDKFYIATNKDKSTNFKIMYTDHNKTEAKNWKEFIKHDENVFIEGITILAKHMIVSEKKNGLDFLRVIDRKTGKSRYIEFKDSAYLVGGYTNADYDSEKYNYTYESMTTPQSVLEYDLNTNQSVLIKERDVLGGFDKNNYESKRIYATARDGKKIPMSIVYRKGTKIDGTAPGLIYGYGSYGHTISPKFSTTRLSLLDRGFVYAIAHIRGGSINGRQWYEDGKLFKKKNTFTDFIDASEFLIKSKYVSKDKLFARGGSAGGLLMGAIINMRPDLYRAVIAQVPFVDVITTMLDDSIPLTTREYDEWGNPNDEDSYQYMKSYSPYDQVKKQKYPHLLVKTGLHDSQVQYWEPAKWVAKLRFVKTDHNLLLLHTNMDAGHGGASGRFEKFKEVAFDFAFLLKFL